MVETGGIILGSMNGYELVIDQLVSVTNAAQMDNTFIITPQAINSYLTRPDFVGLFHTHRFLWFPGIRDIFTTRSLAGKIERQLVLGIRTRQKTHYWLFGPKTIWPRRVRQLTVGD